MGEIKINTDSLQADFYKHLNLEGNYRTIFSGQFGIGKTTFLREFTKNKSDDYNVFHLFPVNYSVASNEDIFELIKYDLFYEVLKFHPDLISNLNLSKEEYLPLFISKNWSDVSQLFLRMIPKLGKPLTEVLIGYKELEAKYKKDLEAFNQSHGDLINVFQTDAENLRGSINEFNHFSELLHALIREVKREKKNLLIIDDLDRVDPDHLFRLLNVFSAHVDINSNENKFGFDKIVFVMDIDNVRNIFKNRFGQDVDFSGYIDKFYSIQVYKFDHFGTIRELIEKVLETTVSFSEFVKLNQRSQGYSRHLIFLIDTFIRIGSLNFRSILKLHNYKFKPEVLTLGRDKYSQPINVRNYAMVHIFEILEYVTGSDIALKICLDKIQDSTSNQLTTSFDERFIKQSIESCLSILLLKKLQNSHDGEKGKYRDKNVEIVYLVKTIEFDTFLKIDSINGPSGTSIILDTKTYFSLIGKAYDKYLDLRNE